MCVFWGMEHGEAVYRTSWKQLQMFLLIRNQLYYNSCLEHFLKLILNTLAQENFLAA